jgi:hypothetical protein
MLRLDHLAISATTLAEGVEAVEAALGLPLAGGGQHPHMATHNRLLGLGDLYLEVIASDPAQPKPAWPRWFDLDNFTGPSRLTNWVAATDDLDAALPLCPPGTGTPVSLQRGDYRWRMAVPANGKLPFDGAFPALIQWQGPLHPARALPDAGARLIRLDIEHPDADTLRQSLPLSDPRLALHKAPVKRLSAVFSTPHGQRVL